MAVQRLCDMCKGIIAPNEGGALAWMTNGLLLDEQTSYEFLRKGTAPGLKRLDLCAPCCDNIELMTKNLAGGGH
jgi:hypothetical protein